MNFNSYLLISLFVIIHLLPCQGSQTNGLLDKVFAKFNSEKYEEALSVLNSNFTNDKKPKLYYRYKSILLSFLVKQTWEVKAGFFASFKTLQRAKNHNDLFIQLYPDNTSAYAGLGEHYQYTPAFFGGGIEKAEKKFQMVIKGNYHKYELYKVLLFYLNTMQDMSKTKLILDLFDNQGIIEKDMYLDAYVDMWLNYQYGVYYYTMKDYEKAEKKILTFIKQRPKTYWGHFMLWKIRKEHYSKNDKELLAKAKQYAHEQKNLAFLDTLKNEVNE